MINKKAILFPLVAVVIAFFLLFIFSSPVEPEIEENESLSLRDIFMQDNASLVNEEEQEVEKEEEIKIDEVLVDNVVTIDTEIDLPKNNDALTLPSVEKKMLVVESIN